MVCARFTIFRADATQEYFDFLIQGTCTSCPPYFRLYTPPPPMSYVCRPCALAYFIAYQCKASFGRKIWCRRQLAPPQKCITPFKCGKMPVAMQRPVPITCPK